MSSKKGILNSFRWIFFVSSRFAKIDRKGRSAVTSFLAGLGICFGVMTLVTVVSVMNGFQRYSINPIMEISSYHLRASGIPEENFADFVDFCENNSRIKCASLFCESQGLLIGKRNKQAAAVIRAVDPNLMRTDEGFAKELKIVYGEFDVNSENSIVLGISLANELGVSVGSEVNIVALAGGKDVSLISQNRKFKVTGVFDCSYYDIKKGYGFVGLASAEKYFGKDVQMIYGIKLKNYENDIASVAELKEKFSDIKIQSWREFNKSFFGTLRIEKNILMLLVCIIFIVVGINIYNGMRRLVFERKQEISVLSALGGTNREIMAIFIARGFSMGFFGSLCGMIIGLFISFNIRPIFTFIAMLLKNPMFAVFAQIPAKVVFSEVFFITIFGIAAPLFASWKASRNVLKMKVAEVLHDE